MSSRNVLKLYREILRTIKKIPDKNDREYMRNWARTDFKNYKNVSDDASISLLKVYIY